MTDPIDLNGDMGGEIQNTIESLNGNEFQCFCDEGTHPCSGWRVYPHDDGVPDKNGKRYWMYIECPKTGNKLALWKIQQRLCR